MEAISVKETLEKMIDVTNNGQVRNFSQLISMKDYLVETEMFSKDVLEAYTNWNLEKDVTDAQREYFDENRGGAQGDYRADMSKKIANVVDCLTKFPKSKRAVITICNNPTPSHDFDGDAKCMRELHLYLEDGKLNGTVLFRAQAAQIFPKNIHFVGSLMKEVASLLPNKPELGDLFYLATVLVSVRAE